MKSQWSRIGFATLFVLLASCSGKDKDGAAVQVGAPDEVAADSPKQSMADLMREIEKQQAEAPRDRIDPAAVAAKSRDLDKILAWVRENTRAISYEGSLRGPLGVLMDRSGNSLDRALLLARLFALAGHEARVVGSRPAQTTVVGPVVAVAQVNSGGAQSELRGVASATAGMIKDKIGQLGSIAQAPEATHYWAQVRDGERWIDADPSLAGIGKAPAGASGEPLAIDATTHGVASESGEGRAGNLLHSVSLRMVVERWEAGRLSESTLAVVDFSSASSPFAALTVTFVPVDREAGKAVQPPFSSGAELSDALLDQTAWAVILADETGRGRIGRMFDDAGIVGDIPVFDATGRLGGQAFGALTGGLAGEESPEDEVEEASTVLTALFADYELKSPGKPPRTVRRSIFDSIGPESRRASGRALERPRWSDKQVIERGADLAAINDTLVTFASLPWDTYVYRYGQRVIDAKDAILSLAAGSNDDATRRRVSQGLAFHSLELYAAERHRAMSPELAIVEPQIYRRIVRFMPTVDTSKLDIRVFADLAWNRLGPVTRNVSTMTAIEQGVLDTLQEREIVLSYEPPPAGENTAALFEEAAKQGNEIVAVRRADDARLAALPGATRARIVNDIEAGNIIVMPSRPLKLGSQARLGWWRVDPYSGQTVGAMDNGLLADTAEYSITKEAEEARIHGYTTEERARNWANEVARRRGGEVSDTQYQNFMKMAAESIEKYGVVPGM